LVFPPVHPTAAATGGISNGADACQPGDKSQANNTFVDDDGKTYDLQALRNARKALEVLFPVTAGHKHQFIQDIDDKLQRFQDKQQKEIPLHVVVGKAQK
jgi:hypothetical protein